MSFRSNRIAFQCARALTLVGIVVGGASSADASGLVWSLPSQNEGWIARAVSLGNYGTQVFSRVDGYTAFSRLLSSYDLGSPSPSAVWQNNGPYYSLVQGVDSAETADTHAALYLYRQTATDPLRPIVVKHNSQSSSPLWSVVFPGNNYSQAGGIHVSRDGARIAAWAFDPIAYRTRLLIFGASATPLVSVDLNTYGEPISSSLSADGRRLLLVSPLVCQVIDVQTGAVLGQTISMESTSEHGFDMTGDGECFARGMAAHRVDLFRHQGNDYVPWFSQDVGAGFGLNQVAVSANGSTMTMASQASTGLGVRLQCVDLLDPQHSVTTIDDLVGGGIYSLWATGLKISDDGRTIALITSGDQLGTAPEIVAYRRLASGAWSRLLSRDLPGSAMSIDLSADGNRLVVGSKATHLNVFGNGGQIDLLDLAPTHDLELGGVPHFGGAVSFDFDAHAAGVPAKILVSRTLGNHPVVFTGLGTLYLSRFELRTAASGFAGADGHFHASVTMSPGALPQLDPSDSTNTQSVQIGRTLYFQGFNGGMRKLSQDWLPVTILP